VKYERFGKFTIFHEFLIL